MGGLLSKAPGLLEALQSLGETQEERKAFIEGVYNEVADKIRPLLQLAPQIAAKAGQDITPVVVAFLKVFTAILRDEDYQEEMEKVTELRAKIRMAALKLYVDAGFTRKEAFALVMQDAANIKAWRGDAFDNSSKGRSNRD